jgi:hypothetical protein
MWKFWPDIADSIEDSTEGNGCRSDMSGGGGVRALFNGDAVYDWSCEAKLKGGMEVRLFSMCGDWLGDCGTCPS